MEAKENSQDGANGLDQMRLIEGKSAGLKFTPD
jgi:hypothetical protein